MEKLSVLSMLVALVTMEEVCFHKTCLLCFWCEVLSQCQGDFYLQPMFL